MGSSNIPVIWVSTEEFWLQDTAGTNLENQIRRIAEKWLVVLFGPKSKNTSGHSKLFSMEAAQFEAANNSFKSII